MLERVVHENGVVFYVSRLLRDLGVAHAFSTRVGGVSERPFDSLNLGNPSGVDVQDDPANIAVNYEWLHASVGLTDVSRCFVHQVHGRDFFKATRGEAFENGRKADAILSDDPSRAVAIRMADCVPVLISTGDGGLVAAIHAGWRGVVLNIVERVVTAMGRPDNLRVAIGPCISLQQFEVGPEVASQFPSHFVKMYQKPHVDLPGAIEAQLRSIGVHSDSIDRTDRCTYRDSEEFFSHRRDAGKTGRLVAIIVPKRV